MPLSLFSIALVMIVKNESNKLSRCLGSVVGLVDEIIVVDTGSTDSTVDIAKSFGARVFDFTWCDDFSAARNFALTQSASDWNFVLDADEWILAPESLVEIRKDTPDYLGLVCVQSDYMLDGLLLRHDDWIPRLLPRGGRYVGAIHEQPEKIFPFRQTGIGIGHDGYVDISHKKGRNRLLLEMELLRNPDNSYYRYQLGKEFERESEYGQAVECYGEVVLGFDSQWPYALDLVTRYIFCLKKVAQFEVAIPFAEQFYGFYHDSADFLFVLGDLLLDYAVLKPDEIPILMPIIEAAWLGCLRVGERNDVDGVRGRGSFLAAHNLAVLYEFNGNFELAGYYHKLEALLRS